MQSDISNVIIVWGRTYHHGWAEYTLPITYSTCYSATASINSWTANAPYSIGIGIQSLSKIVIDHWYNSGDGLGNPCSFLTVGY